tara:strand:- start:1306 stop:1947 length:642 start_codon:yes stop_codon:yes gene_type:complete
MALNKLKFNSINVTPAASKAIRFNSSANGLETASAGGNLIKIASTTASSSSSVSFTSGIDSTYKEYIFFFNNLHPSESAKFQVNFSIDGGSNYNVAKTTTAIQIYHNETNDSDTGFTYSSGGDLAQGTGAAQIGQGATTGNDESLAGVLHLFDPSNTTFVKHFIADTISTNSSYAYRRLHAGYGNTTSAINAVQFSQSAGNIDSGTITMYGVL